MSNSSDTAAQKYIDILGLPFSVSGDREVVDRIRHCIKEKNVLTIVQPHFFHTVLGRSDSTIADLYRKYDLILPDGYGVYLAGRFLYGKEKAFGTIFNGTDFYESLLREAAVHHWRIFFLGDTEIIIEALKLRVCEAYPGLSIAGAHHGFIDEDDKAFVSLVNESNADILLIGMGTPKQDFWLWRHRKDIRVPVMMTVGAGIGFISGEKKRAPKLWRTLHVEWLFRLFQEPRRLWYRYLFGIPKFVLYVILQKVKQA